jgi:hypothetical protein
MSDPPFSLSLFLRSYPTVPGFLSQASSKRALKQNCRHLDWYTLWDTCPRPIQNARTTIAPSNAPLLLNMTSSMSVERVGSQNCIVSVRTLKSNPAPKTDKTRTQLARFFCARDMLTRASKGTNRPTLPQRSSRVPRTLAKGLSCWATRRTTLELIFSVAEVGNHYQTILIKALGRVPVVAGDQRKGGIRGGRGHFDGDDFHHFH